MRKFILIVLVLTSPIWIIGLSARITFNKWFIDYEYSKKDFPKDKWNMPQSLRKELAYLGLKSVLTEEGLKELENKTFPNGLKAFRKKEVKHMQDVNKFLSIFFPMSYLIFFLWLVYFLISKNKKLLIYSGGFTILLIIILGSLTILFYNTAFATFHDFIFGKGTWRFKQTDTLLRIYPMKFWFDGTIIVILFSIFTSIILVITGLFLIKKEETDVKTG